VCIHIWHSLYIHSITGIWSGTLRERDHCTALYYTALCYTILYCTVLYCTVLYCTVL
jgi:hypothetical protein